MGKTKYEQLGNLTLKDIMIIFMTVVLRHYLHQTLLLQMPLPLLLTA